MTAFCGVIGPLNLAGKSWLPFLTIVTPLGLGFVSWIMPDALGKLGFDSKAVGPTSFSSSNSMTFQTAFALERFAIPRILIDRIPFFWCAAVVAGVKLGVISILTRLFHKRCVLECGMFHLFRLVCGLWLSSGDVM